MSGSAHDRCPLCEARALAPTERSLVYPSGRSRRFERACSFCGLLLAGEASLKGIRADFLDRLDGPGFRADEEVPYGLDIYTLRIAATTRCRGVEPCGPDQADALRHPHALLAAAADFHDFAPTMPAVSLGILCRPADIDTVRASLPAHSIWTDDVAILVDDAPAQARPMDVAGFAAGAVRLAARPLGSDFAAQRNHLQALSRHGWMLQLDADETLGAETGAMLGALVRMAEEQGVRSIGLPRRNLVGGVLSDLYPDTQYRLNERGLRYAGRVHERPGRPWQESLITLHGAILHHLDRDHVETRSARYEAMEPGGGRLEEARLLARPYRA